MRHFKVWICLVILILFTNNLMGAGFKIYGYKTLEKGEFEIVYFNNYFAKSDLLQGYFGKIVDREGLMFHSLELEYGLTDRWTIAAYLDFEQPNGEDFKYTRFRGVFFRYRFFRKNRCFMDPALYIEYYLPRKEYKNEQEIEIKLIVEKQIGKTSIKLNPSVEKVVKGPEVDEGLKFNYAAGLYYQFTEKIRGGLEFFGKMGEISEIESSDKRHWFFPALKIKLPYHIGWEIGGGFGLTDKSDDFVVKNILSIEF